MDPSALIPFVSPVVMALVAYLREEAATKAGEAAAETVGTEAGKALAQAGPHALTTLRSWFTKTADAKAQRALADVEADPTDDDYRQKLVKETNRLARADAAFAQELKVLAEYVTIAQPGSTVQTFHTKDSIVGVVGTSTGPVTLHIGKMPNDDD